MDASRRRHAAAVIKAGYAERRRHLAAIRDPVARAAAAAQLDIEQRAEEAQLAATAGGDRKVRRRARLRPLAIRHRAERRQLGVRQRHQRAVIAVVLGHLRPRPIPMQRSRGGKRVAPKRRPLLTRR